MAMWVFMSNIFYFPDYTLFVQVFSDLLIVIPNLLTLPLAFCIKTFVVCHLAQTDIV